MKDRDTFREYIREVRKEFADVVRTYSVSDHLELRTICDDLLIAYDQMTDRLFQPKKEEE